ncbi:DUF6894 family protein [Bradyrhizobium xenonodulans]|uniref:DUF6894 family protein n=1 Tax=Bradyrhizobium xenonodulans TaxID=2736875 RepID=UPI003F8FE989
MRFYFDYKDSAGTILDDQGEDLPDFATACDAAMRYLAEGIRDHSPSELTDKLSVLVRTKDVPILTVSATIDVTAAAPISSSRKLS